MFDTNIVLDLLLDRKPFANAAAQLFSRMETGRLAGCVCATTVTTIHYLATKILGATKARTHITTLLSLFEVAPVNRPVLEAALSSAFKDFEDAVIHEAALNVGVQALVTRDVTGFKNARIPVYTPDELLHILRSQEQS
jgi:predicted nucleic acid-binding protein